MTAPAVGTASGQYAAFRFLLQAACARLSATQEDAIIDEVLGVVRGGRIRARKPGMPAADLQAMKHLFITGDMPS